MRDAAQEPLFDGPQPPRAHDNEIAFLLLSGRENDLSRRPDPEQSCHRSRVERKERERPIEQSFSIRAHVAFNLVVELLRDLRNHHRIRRLWDIEDIEYGQLIDGKVLEQPQRFIGVFRSVNCQQCLHR